MATKQSAKNRIQKILSVNSTSIYSDDYWAQVSHIWECIRQHQAELIINSAEYAADGMTKTWKFEVKSAGYVFQGVLNAHAAGSVKDPFDRYDISAYIF